MKPLPPFLSDPQGRMTTLHPKDLHPLYQSVTYEEAIAIANLGAQVYEATKAGLFDLWNAGQTAEEVVKADLLRREGGQSMLDSLKKQLAAGEAAVARAAALQASIDEQVGQRVLEVLDTHRKDFELAKMAETAEMRERLAAAKAREEMTHLLKESHVVMKEKIAILETRLAEQLIANTKSSHAIGKAGEATVLELLNTAVIPTLPYASVKDMTAVGHAADFHLSVMLETGTKAKILIDSKKYKRRVNTTEIEKLFADVDADEEAHAGLMISIESHIFTMKQFQIARTPLQKPVLFISFCDVTEELRKDLTIWAVRILIDILSQKTSDDKESMLTNIEGFLKEMDEVVTELDGGIRGITKSLEGIKSTRDGIIRKLVNFRAGKPVETEIQTALLEGCGHITRSGAKCGKKCASGIAFCKTHVKKTEITHVE